MKNQQITADNKKGFALTLTGVAVMILLTLTKIVPSSAIAGYAIFVGIAFFFLTEAATKTKGDQSGLRFHTIMADLKKPNVIFWAMLPIVSGLATLAVGYLIFGREFAGHVMGRTGALLSFDKIVLLVGQIILAAFGEEIAFRGFFFGKGSKICPAWVCAVASSACFAAGHIAVGSVGLVAYDVGTIFIDSLIFSAIYLKTENCVISTISHILANAVSITLVLLL